MILDLDHKPFQIMYADTRLWTRHDSQWALNDHDLEIKLYANQCFSLDLLSYPVKSCMFILR